MSIEDLAAEIAPSVPGAPYPTLVAALEQIFRELTGQGVDDPEEYPEAMSYGARWKLFSMHGTAWADRSQAQDNFVLYREARHRAKVAQTHNEPGYIGRTTVPRF